MPDERVRLVQKVNGMTEIRVLASDVDSMGMDWLYQELATRDLPPEVLGWPSLSVSHPPVWKIPVRRTE